MKKILFLLIILLGIISCNSKIDIIQGDLYFKQYDFDNLYYSDKERVKNIRKEIDSLWLIENLPEIGFEKFYFFDKLERNNLLTSPYIRIQTDSTIVRIFLSEKEFEKVKEFKHSDLIKEHQKITLQIEIKELDENIYYSDRIINFVKVYGQTYWKK